MAYKINIIISWELTPENREKLINEVMQYQGKIESLWTRIDTNTSTIFKV
jgi:hypothetical protein